MTKENFINNLSMCPRI